MGRSKISRREFVKVVGAFTGAMGLGSSVGCRSLRAGLGRRSSSTEPPKKVFAHYMIIAVGYPPYPGNYEERVSAYKKEILHAQSKGIDGFVINTGVWDPSHKEACDAMYEAAKEVDREFKLFFSIDYNLTTQFDRGGRRAAEYAREIVTRYSDHPCQFRWDGRQVVSTFYGSQYPKEFWEEEFIRPLAAQRVNIFFIPNFHRYGKVRDPSMADYVSGIYSDYPFVDGLFYFGSAGVPPQIIRANRIHTEVARKLGKLYMATVSPTYSPPIRSNNRLFDYQGGEGLSRIWEEIIRDDPPWVQIVSWNDYGEQHYVGPSESNIDDTRRFPHLAYLELCAYYIQWFKTGLRPAIHEDKVLYFYRSHSKDATAEDAPLSKPHGWESVSDSVYVTAMLAAPAKLEIRTGHGGQTHELPAGIHDVSGAFQEGAQEVRLVRDDRTIIESTGRSKINNDISRYNFNYYSNFEVGDAWPPSSATFPRSWVLLQNYPNPFARETRIRFWAPANQTVKLQVLDNEGKEVTTLLDGPVEAGKNSVAFDGKSVLPGLYYYKLTAGSHSETKRMVVLKRESG